MGPRLFLFYHMGIFKLKIYLVLLSLQPTLVEEWELTLERVGKSKKMDSLGSKKKYLP